MFPGSKQIYYHLINPIIFEWNYLPFPNFLVPFKIKSFKLDDFVYYFTVKCFWLSMYRIIQQQNGHFDEWQLLRQWLAYPDRSICWKKFVKSFWNIYKPFTIAAWIFFRCRTFNIIFDVFPTFHIIKSIFHQIHIKYTLE